MAKEAVFTGDAAKISKELFFLSASMHAEKYKGMIHPALALKVFNLGVTFHRFADEITKETIEDIKREGEAVAASRCLRAYFAKTNETERETFAELEKFLNDHFSQTAA